jgi:hypothetical protein
LLSGVLSFSIIPIQIKQAINPEAISRMFTIAPMAGIIEKSAWKREPRKYQKPVMLF